VTEWSLIFLEAGELSKSKHRKLGTLFHPEEMKSTKKKEQKDGSLRVLRLFVVSACSKLVVL
jgi:hypothetical protein